MRMFEIPIGACSLWFEPLAEVMCPRQSPFTVPSPWLRGLHASFVLPIRPKATCHFPSFPTMMVSTPSTSGVLYNSVTTFTTFPFSLVAYVHLFFSLLAGFDSHQQVHLHFFTMMCPTLNVTFPLAHYRDTLYFHFPLPHYLTLFLCHFTLRVPCLGPAESTHIEVSQ